MKGIRICLAALAISLFSGLDTEADAGNWVVRVQMESVFNGHTYYPTLYSSTNKSDAASAYAWYELLMKVYPQKFRTDVLNPLGVPSYYVPIRMHFLYLSGINPTGRP
ncbi:hypothetical protein NZK35_20740 [Stieleria sp. ICT_E10.1]|uniref:hypothetical protein n=1 Tax=Stieleria sedimenti TaxID=2976331 RepID=UPI0021802616|nr:hypothetical protein [Stieleria sedimenti]MCS7469087.1 hypothetical protein [Stieleria sedimenti]